MKIFKANPESWQDLQNKCSKLLTDIGFTTEVEQNIVTVRETVNVDVLAINKVNIPNEVIIVECKNWMSNVPKTVVHSLRTVVSDFGANSGYIISKVGFQKGAYDAVLNTNISLMDFDEFQEHFKVRYLNAITTKLQSVGYPLRKYSDYMESFWYPKYDKLPKEKQLLHKELSEKYDTISLASLIVNYKSILTGELELEYIDQIISERIKWFPKDIIVESYSEYFDFLISFCQKGVDEFDELFGEKLRKY